MTDAAAPRPRGRRSAGAADRAHDRRRPVRVPEGTTLLHACRAGIETPTLCYLENLTPVNVCRVCVVELEGSRVLVPACSRRAETGMVVQTDSERVRPPASSCSSSSRHPSTSR